MNPRGRPRTPKPPTPRELELLAFAAEHRFVLAEQVGELLGVDRGYAAQRLRDLTGSGQLVAGPSLAGSTCFQVTRAGLRSTGSRLPVPRPVDPGRYDHDVGLAWLWVAARRGALGPVHSVISEREMRSSDQRRPAPPERYAIGLPGGGARVHYPDLLLLTRSGRRVAVELELSAKGARRTERIMGDFAFDRRLDGVLYLVKTERKRTAIERSAARAGVADLVQVRLLHFDPVARVLQPGASGQRALGHATEPVGPRPRTHTTSAPLRLTPRSGRARDGEPVR